MNTKGAVLPAVMAISIVVALLGAAFFSVYSPNNQFYLRQWERSQNHFSYDSAVGRAVWYSNTTSSAFPDGTHHLPDLYNYEYTSTSEVLTSQSYPKILDILLGGTPLWAQTEERTKYTIEGKGKYDVGKTSFVVKKEFDLVASAPDTPVPFKNVLYAGNSFTMRTISVAEHSWLTRLFVGEGSEEAEIYGDYYAPEIYYYEPGAPPTFHGSPTEPANPFPTVRIPESSEFDTVIRTNRELREYARQNMENGKLVLDNVYFDPSETIFWPDNDVVVKNMVVVDGDFKDFNHNIFFWHEDTNMNGNGVLIATGDIKVKSVSVFTWGNNANVVEQNFVAPNGTITVDASGFFTDGIGNILTGFMYAKDIRIEAEGLAVLQSKNLIEANMIAEEDIFISAIATKIAENLLEYKEELWDPESPYYLSEEFQRLMNRGSDATKFGIEKGSWE